MYYSNCPYEKWSGACGGCKKLDKGQPHCAEEDEYFEALAAQDDMLCDRQDDYENRRGDYWISNR
ncbi:MAG: hypothetical protein EOM03_15215 [Clostridia bacterium]|nr:hypothetical protein [Clostridia bacterium]